MFPTLERNTIDEAIVVEAADVVTETVRKALTEALRAAEVCGCRACRARAARTFDWAVAMLGLGDEDGMMHDA